jgi:hypothetical protein
MLREARSQDIEYTSLANKLLAIFLFEHRQTNLIQKIRDRIPPHLFTEAVSLLKLLE